MRKVFPVILALSALVTTPAVADLDIYKVVNSQTLRLHLTRGNMVSACSKSFAAKDYVAVEVRVKRHALPRINPNNDSAQDGYYAGRGTLVESRSTPKAGPICVRALTWNRSEKVTVKFGNLGPNPQLAVKPIKPRRS